MMTTDMTCLVADGRTLGELAFDVLSDRATGKRSVPTKMAIPSRLQRGNTVHLLA